MSQQTITLLFLVFTIISFILEKDTTWAYSFDLCNRIDTHRSSGCIYNVFTVCKQ